MALTDWLRNLFTAPRELVAHQLGQAGADPRQVFRKFRMRRSYRIRYMVLGGLIILAGLATPWVITQFTPPGGSVTLNGTIYDAGSTFSNGFDFGDSAKGQGDSLTLSGIANIEWAAGVVLATGLFLLIVNPQEPSPRTRLVNFLVSLLPRLFNFFTIYAFVRYAWWSFAEDGVQQDTVRHFLFLNGGSQAALDATRWIAVYPLPGFFITLFGLVLAAIGLYSGTSRLTEEQIAARNQAGLAVVRGLLSFVGRVIATAILIALLLAVLVNTVDFQHIQIG
ncbi:hypothetical protein BC739_000359 [Kutzneria viridogrisea]|uniref:Uncharacterized protein n=2 Tax=Kutzneria TaxID=43356 RepID=W5WM86_9PSEU|nr:hypothetical protein [Kutzneria albida]AHH99284.1 hypothetical protein KALB_5923 [Kutzneria albida DSM 43870]MBA8923162.1 hypothetical protein [Kutzneria viridogrisea]